MLRMIGMNLRLLEGVLCAQLLEHLTSYLRSSNLQFSLMHMLTR